MADDNTKARNSQLAQCINLIISGWEPIIPIGQLMVFLHSLHGLGINWGNGEDKAEKRNRAYCEFLHPTFDRELINAIISSHFKPTSFIHPFETYHTTAGYNDASVMSSFCRAVDNLAENYRARKFTNNQIEFLSFIYIVFLLVHPFMDGNGRVARSLLDYYNAILKFGLKQVWNNAGFKSEKLHKKAFVSFFSETAQISNIEKMMKDAQEINFPDITLFLVRRRDEIDQLAASITRCCESIMKVHDYGTYSSISAMADNIRKLQKE